MVWRVLVVVTVYTSRAGGPDAHVGLAAGARWMPFPLRRGRWFDFSAVYLKGSLGIDTLRAVTATQLEVDWSPEAAVAYGYLPIQLADWALGAEFREQLTHYGDAFQHTWTLLGVVQVRG